MIFAGLPLIVFGIVSLKVFGGYWGWIPLALGFCTGVAGGVDISKTAPQG